jgi:hypothetical protein
MHPNPFEFCPGPQPLTRARLGLPVSTLNRKRRPVVQRATKPRLLLPALAEDNRHVARVAAGILVAIALLSGAVALLLNA